MYPKLSVFDFAVLSKLLDLSERYGLKPYEVGCDVDTAHGFIRFHSGPAGMEKHQQYEKMKAALGCVNHRLEIEDGEELFDRLDKAIRTAPRARVI